MSMQAQLDHLAALEDQMLDCVGVFKVGGVQQGGSIACSVDESDFRPLEEVEGGRLTSKTYWNITLASTWPRETKVQAGWRFYVTFPDATQATYHVTGIRGPESKVTQLTFLALKVD